MALKVCKPSPPPPRRLARSMKMNGDCVRLTLGGTEQAELWEPTKEAKRRLRNKGSQEPGFQVREQDIQEGGSDLLHGGMDQLSHLGKQNKFFPEYARTDQDDLKKIYVPDFPSSTLLIGSPLPGHQHLHKGWE